MYIPLYHGYKEKELRRESDRILRNYIYETLNSSIENLKKSQNILTQRDKIDSANKISKIIVEYDTIAQKINHAEAGYFGFWDSVKIKETDLDDLYELDNKITNICEKTKKAANEFFSIIKSSDVDELETKSLKALENIAPLEAQVSKRKLLLHGVG